MGDALFGNSGLLRIAGLPIRYWLAAANPQLFDQIRQFEQDEVSFRAAAKLVAERIGQQLIPDPSLTREDRALLLAIRRRLHRGEPLIEAFGTHLPSIATSTDDAEELIRVLGAMVDRDRALAALSAVIEAELVTEQERLFLLPGDIYHDSRMGQSLFPTPDGATPPRSQKQRRHRFEHEWHRVMRAATGTTPRDWLSHVALVPIESSTLMPPSVTSQFTAQWTSNVRTRRLALAEPPVDWPEDESRLAMNPLHWESDRHLVFVVVKNDGQIHVSVKHTGLLDAISDYLSDVVLTFGELAHALGCVREDEQAALRTYVRHLMSLGILQSSEPPIVRLETRATPGATFDGTVEADIGRTGWIDVYRHAEGGVSRDIAEAVQDGGRLVLRILQQMQADATVVYEQTAPTTERSWMFTDILRGEMDTHELPTQNGNDATETEGDSSLPADSSLIGSHLQQLVARFPSGVGILIDNQVLDELGVSKGELN